ncbi:hypothetical protein N431DRAFT_480545, partial [Stipitochalara longipes BDJ]
MYISNASIEIAASPELVREKFLDCSQLQTYHPNGFYKSISTVTPNEPIQPGTKMVNVLEIMTAHATIEENSPACFRWGGGIPGIFVGTHSFYFGSSTETRGGTTFIQEEKFTGIFTLLMGDNFIARVIGILEKTMKGWKRYNKDLKVWCERSNNENERHVVR